MTTKSSGSTRMTKKERYYRKLLRKQKKSGLSNRELAGQEGITAALLRVWKCRIAKKDRERVGGLRRRRSKPPTRSAAGARARASAAGATALPLLLPVRVVGEVKPASADTEQGFEVLLRSGHVVRVPQSFGTDDFGRLVRVLEAAC